MEEEEPKGEIVIPNSRAEDIRPQFPYMKKVIRWSKTINMWPNEKNKNAFLYHLTVWMIIVICLTFIFSFFVQIQRDFKNMDSVTALIDFVTVFISGTFRFIYVYVRGDKYLLMVSLVHNNFIHCPLFPSENKPTILKYYKNVNKLITMYVTFTFFWILQVCTTPILGYIWEVYKLPTPINETQFAQIPYPVAMKVYAPFDYYKQPANAFFYIYQAVGFIVFGWIYVVVDSFWFTVIFLTIAQFVLLKESLNTIAEIIKKNDVDEGFKILTDNEVRQLENGLKQCVQHHQFTRKFVHLLDDLSNPNILIDSLHAVISIGFILLDVIISLNTGDWNKVMYSFEYFITSMVHMYFFDWMGNELAEKEQELAEAIYEIQWYRCPTQKPVIQLMTIQSRRPYRLTGGKMYKLSMEFFASTIKAVFSYFTFLFQLRNGKPKL